VWEDGQATDQQEDQDNDQNEAHGFVPSGY
jgi:hypothetical protein